MNSVIHYMFSRHFNSGKSNVIDTAKLQVKKLVLNQWKLIVVLKNVVSKYTKNKTFEKRLSKEFILFLQKIDFKLDNAELIRPFVSISNVDIKGKKDDRSSSVLPTVGLPKTVNEKESKEILPKWKEVSKSVISKVTTFYN